MSYFELYDRLSRTYAPARASALDAGGFVTEIAGKVVLTAPAGSVRAAGQVPEALRERWERAATRNPYYQWVGGRFVEAERANRNGAFWSTGDLEFGQLSVNNGPLNWLHEGRKVVGTIVDHTLVPAGPAGESAAEAGAAVGPHISVVNAVWRWLYPQEAKVIEMAGDLGELHLSMECVARSMQCVASEASPGCGQVFDYALAMTAPERACEHIAARSAHRRMVDPYFLGGGVIVPPTRPGWSGANAVVLRQAAELAERVAPPDAQAARWESLMEAVMAFACG